MGSKYIYILQKGVGRLAMIQQRWTNHNTLAQTTKSNFYLFILTAQNVLSI